MYPHQAIAAVVVVVGMMVEVVVACSGVLLSGLAATGATHDKLTLIVGRDLENGEIGLVPTLLPAGKCLSCCIVPSARMCVIASHCSPHSVH